MFRRLCRSVQSWRNDAIPVRKAADTCTTQTTSRSFSFG